MRLLKISLLLLFSTTALIAEGSSNVFPEDFLKPQPIQKSKYPVVFLIDDNSSNAFEDLSMEYKTSLIEAFDNDMDVAYRNWMEMMCEMEKFAERKKLDIKGVKVWMKVFWSTDGKIEHIAYHLKPNSRNISTDLLNRFFKDFTRLYAFELKTTKVFSHYTSVSFPNYYCRPKK